VLRGVLGGVVSQVRWWRVVGSVFVQVDVDGRVFAGGVGWCGGGGQ
jgi:hypothetical protein